MQFKPLPPEREAQIPHNLIQDIRERRVLAFIGAGLSMSAGYPDWKSLIKQVFNYILDHEWRNTNNNTIKWIESNCISRPDWVAEVLKHNNPSTFNKATDSIFPIQQKTYSLSHALLAAIPFVSYITTNFDTLVEDYIRIFDYYKPRVITHESIEPSKLISILNSDNSRFVFKSHGDISNGAANLVLTSSEFHSVTRNEVYMRLLSHLLVHYTIFVAGFSLRGLDFQHILEERHHLFQGACAPMYVMLPEPETCEEEIDLFKKKFNVHIVPISIADNHQDLPSILISIFCLVNKLNPDTVFDLLINLFNFRLNKEGYQIDFDPTKVQDYVYKANRMVSCFSDNVDPRILVDIDIHHDNILSEAHYRVLFQNTGRKIVPTAHRIDRNNVNEAKNVAKWFGDQLALMADEKPIDLTIYQKNLFNQYVGTITKLLMTKEGWKSLVRGDEYRFKILNEYYRQHALWGKWLNVIDKALETRQKKSIKTKLIQCKLWVLFWTRRSDELERILNSYPEADVGKGEYSYFERLQYMRVDRLEDFVEKLSNKAELDFFRRSLLGRAYARLAINRSFDEKARNAFFEKARENLRIAVDDAKSAGNMVEVSVQLWYLGCVELDLGNTKEGKDFLAETRRIDESIMDRRPGLAWLALSDYLIEVKEKGNLIEKKRLDAIESMRALGMTDAENFVDNDYYY